MSGISQLSVSFAPLAALGKAFDKETWMLVELVVRAQQKGREMLPVPCQKQMPGGQGGDEDYQDKEDQHVFFLELALG